MENFTASDANSALNLLSDIALRRQEEISTFNVTRDLLSSDDENDSPCPYFDQFYNQGGSESIAEMCNFDATEFEFLWQLSQSFITQNYNSGRGKRCAVSGKDLLFMTLTVLKHGGHWDVLARVFKLKGPTFERMVTKFVALISDHLFALLVTDIRREFTMKNLDNTHARFSNFPEALYAVDVTFQQSFRPSGQLAEGKLFFSGKHKLYGVKVEVGVLPNGLAISCSGHYPGSVSDFEILQRRRSIHTDLIQKQGNERDLVDIGFDVSTYPEQWAVLADKGYQGCQEIFRTIHPIKRPPRGVLSMSDEAFNRRVSSDRIIVENWFGRLSGLWALFGAKWRWSGTIYDDFFRLAAALTNFHVKNHPLRAQDGDKYAQMRNRLAHIANQGIENRRRVLARYQERRRVRLNQEFRRRQHASHATEPSQ